MRISSYNQKQLNFLKKKYLVMNTRELTKLFNKTFGQRRTEAAIRTVLFRKKIKCGRLPKDRLVNRVRLFTPEQLKWLRENYPCLSQAEITAKFNNEFKTNRSDSQIRAAIRNHKIKSGRTGQFKKGSKPWNADTKGTMKRNRTTFKKGNRPHNTKHLFYERDTKDDYVQISVPEINPHTGYPRRFKAKHVWLWEQKNGPVPDGHVVIFSDGDNRNFDIDNLVLLSRLELLRLNKLQHRKAPDEIKPVLMTLAKVEAKVIEVSRHKK